MLCACVTSVGRRGQFFKEISYTHECNLKIHNGQTLGIEFNQ